MGAGFQMNKKHKGACAELRAAAWLLEQGYEVFRNVSGFGEIDIVAVKAGIARFFDVKAGYRGGSPTPGVEYISPMADGSFRIVGARRPRGPRYRDETPREKILRRLALVDEASANHLS